MNQYTDKSRMRYGFPICPETVDMQFDNIVRLNYCGRNVGLNIKYTDWGTRQSYFQYQAIISPGVQHFSRDKFQLSQLLSFIYNF